MFTIERDAPGAHIGGNDTEHDAEASELGLKPGEWPTEICLGDRIYYRIRVDECGGSYHTLNRVHSLVVFND